MIYSIALARTGTVLPAVREITGIKKKFNTVTYNFRIKSEICNMPIESDMIQSQKNVLKVKL